MTRSAASSLADTTNAIPPRPSGIINTVYSMDRSSSYKQTPNLANTPPSLTHTQTTTSIASTSGCGTSNAGFFYDPCSRTYQLMTTVAFVVICFAVVVLFFCLLLQPRNRVTIYSEELSNKAAV
jgi:hypothetical protein